MLYQDTLTGMLHEVPDGQIQGWGLGEDPYGVGEAQMVYDGLGNPLGWSLFKSLGRLVKKAAPFATSLLGPYGQIINRALPIVTQALSGPEQAFDGVPVGLPGPVFPSPIAMRPPYPGGWQRPSVPYTGPHPRRLYLRCSAWRGPHGLVPGAAAMGPAITPTPVLPGVVAPVGVARPMARRRGRSYRRR